MVTLPFPRVLQAPEPVIETARVSDIPRLVEFTTRIAPLPRTELERFPANQGCWQSLITAQDVVCARAADGNINGYYAINHLPLVFGPEEIHSLRSAHHVLSNRFRISPSNVSFGAQALLDPALKSSSLRVLLLRSLLRTVGLRYRYLFTEVRKSNSQEMFLLPREGWRCFHEEDDVCYMMLDIPKALRQLASLLLLRLPARPPSSFSQANHS